ncbi:MAG: sigma-54 dependent transcriptional regulator [Thermodesulfovibrionales bacterium]|nr:sigma-54 dependent transcriptional regulator [Thermodesulfovibrionales bacterium]
MAKVLVVDDEEQQRDIIVTILEDEGINTLGASSVQEALELINKYEPEVVLTDLRLGKMNGIELMEKVLNSKNTESDRLKPSFIILTAYGTISSAVEAVKKGAFDYLTKPIDRDVLLISVRRALERERIVRENIKLKKALSEHFKVEGIVGRAPGFVKAISMAKLVSQTNTTVLITGESGTGKELIAKAIHYNSPRHSKPFVAINCASIPETLIESELFGYEPGAFTGAATRKKGLFEIADEGTLFLDEIGELPLSTQAKLLRALQEKEIWRVGGREPVRIDVRIVAATNRNLEEELKKGRFREDLFYRLRVVTIEMPPLRERREDIPVLVEHFIKKYSKEFRKEIKSIEPSALRRLERYHWPGNVRQLMSVIERAVIMADDIIRLEHIEDELKDFSGRSPYDVDIPPEGLNLEELERALFKKAMERANGVIAKAAKLLGLSYKAFWYRWQNMNNRD